MIFFIVIFGISNTQPFVLYFLDYRLVFAVNLWILLMIFFFTGMIPIAITNLSERLTFRRRMRVLNKKIKQVEKAINSINEKTGPQYTE